MANSYKMGVAIFCSSPKKNHIHFGGKSVFYFLVEKEREYHISYPEYCGRYKEKQDTYTNVKFESNKHFLQKKNNKTIQSFQMKLAQNFLLCALHLGKLTISKFIRLIKTDINFQKDFHLLSYIQQPKIFEMDGKFTSIVD